MYYSVYIEFNNWVSIFIDLYEVFFNLFDINGGV